MIRGLHLTSFNQYNNYLFTIFSSVNCEDYQWFITEDEIYTKTANQLSPLFEKKELSGFNFLQLIKDNLYYLIFINIQAYKKENTAAPIFFKNYQEFYNSDCNLILLCTDSIYFDIYCKNIDILENIAERCRNHFLDVHFITEQNDSRTRLSVW